MGLMSTIGDDISGAVQGALGISQKAKLYFLPDPEGKGIVTSDNIGGTANALAAAKGMLEGASAMAGGVSASSLFSGVGGYDTGREFPVDFNPSTVRISAVGGGSAQVQTIGGKNSPGQASFQKLDARVDVSMQLLFDAVVNQDAFAEDKRIPELVNVAKGAVNLARTLSGEEFSVLPQIEGLHAAMRIHKASLVEFRWGSVCFRGSMTMLNTQYTMFSNVGNPIRAIANITISSSGDEVKEWYRAYTKMFGDKSAVGTQSFGQTVSGLLNL